MLDGSVPAISDRTTAAHAAVTCGGWASCSVREAVGGDRNDYWTALRAPQ